MSTQPVLSQGTSYEYQPTNNPDDPTLGNTLKTYSTALTTLIEGMVQNILELQNNNGMLIATAGRQEQKIVELQNNNGVLNATVDKQNQYIVLLMQENEGMKKVQEQFNNQMKSLFERVNALENATQSTKSMINQHTHSIGMDHQHIQFPRGPEVVPNSVITSPPNEKL
jgi:hypothetical protein